MVILFSPVLGGRFLSLVEDRFVPEHPGNRGAGILFGRVNLQGDVHPRTFSHHTTTGHEGEPEIPRFTGRACARHPLRVPVKGKNHQWDKSCARTCMTGAAATVGTHAVTITGGTATNHAITDVPGTLTVTTSTTTPPPLLTMIKVVVNTNKKHEVTEVDVIFSGAVNSLEADFLATYRLATPGKKGSYTGRAPYGGCAVSRQWAVGSRQFEEA